MNKARLIFRAEIHAFVDKYPPDTNVVTVGLGLDKVKPGFNPEDYHRDWIKPMFKIWWEESVQALTEFEERKR